MTTTDVPSVVSTERHEEPGERPPRRRPLRSRLSAGHALMVMAALLAAVANFAVLRAQTETVEIMVAAGDLAAGQRVQAGDLRPVPLEVDGTLLESLLTPSAVTGLGEVVATTAVPAGTPLRPADLRAVSADGGLRRMSIPVPSERAAGGAIAVGDRVDVIDVVDGQAHYVVAGAPVLAVGAGSSGALGGGLGGFSVTVGVDADAALCLAQAVEAGSLSVVVSTGQPAAPAGGCP